MSDSEIAVKVKKDKKSKKSKKEPVEEVAEEEPEVEKPVKKSKKKSKKEAEPEPEPEPELEAEAEAETNGEEANGDEETSDYQIDQEKVNEVVKQLGEVTKDLINTFRSAAQKCVKKHNNDPIVPMAAALAVLTGATKKVTTSILTGREGFTTYQLTKYDDEIRGKSFAFVIIKRILGEEEGDAAVSHLKFTQDRKSLIFDIPSSYDETIEANWYSTKNLELKPLTGPLPALEEGGSFQAGRGRGRGGFGNDRGRGRGGFGNDRGRGRGGRGGSGADRGGFKRSFDGEAPSENKKIKFDDDE